MLQELREKRAKAVENAKAIMALIDDEARSLTDEETRSFEAYMNEADSLKTQIERAERLDDAERSLDQSRGRKTPNIITRQTDSTNEALRSWLTGTERDFNFDLRSLPYTGGDLSQWANRAQSFAAGAGGELVPEGFVAQVETAIQTFGGVRNVADIIRTATGNDLPWPTSDDTANKGVIVDPNALRNSQDIAFGVKTLKSFTVSSNVVLVPFELLEDSGIALGSFVADRLGERIGRGLADYFATGSGIDQPEGIVTAAFAGPAQATLSAITYNELLDIEHSIDPAHRKDARWMFNDQTLKAIKKITDSNGDPIWANMKDGAPATILGYPYVIVQEMDGLEVVSGRSIVFGNTKAYKVREVKGIRLQKLSERYAEFGQIGFLAHARADGRLIDPGANAVTAFINAAA